jgi:predicted amidohydrolase YtcJ
MRLVEHLLPPPAPDDLEEAVPRGQAHLHRLGITAWQDASVGPEALAAYRAVAAQGSLTARVVAALTWDPGRGLEQVAELVERRRDGAAGRLRATAVKVFQDGVVENFTAAMLAPYLDAQGAPTANSGISMVPAAELAAAVILLDREGFDVHVHAIGDRAVREALDAVDAALAANGPRDARHQLAHIQLVHPEDRPRFGRLGVIANAQPFWAVLDGYMRDLTLPFLTAERAAWQYPFASLARAGAHLAFGSDWTVSTADPLLEMEVASHPATAGPSRSCPASGSTWPPPWTPSPPARPTRSVWSARPARSSRGSSPTWPSSTATRSRPAPARSATPACSPPWSRASRSGPTPCSAGEGARLASGVQCSWSPTAGSGSARAPTSRAPSWSPPR